MVELVRLPWPTADSPTGPAAVPATESPMVGDRFEAVYWPLFVKAFRLAYRIVGNKPEAEDVAAEALARTHMHWKKVGSLAYRDAWVLRVASNLSRSVVRRRRRFPSARPEQAFEETVVVRAAIAAAVSTLPRRQREAIALRFLAGLDIAEIASCLGISVESTRTHIRRGLDALRARFTMEDDHALD